MKIIPLPLETQARLNCNTKIILDYTDLNGTGVASANNVNFRAAWTSGTAQSIEPITPVANNVPYPTASLGATTNQLPAGTRISNAIANVTTAFASSGGAITSLGLTLGDAGSATRFLQSIDCKTVAYTQTTSAAYVESAVFNVLATATIVGQTMASLNAGQIEIYCNIEPIYDLVAVK